MDENRGFTFIELLLVICIMGIVLGSGVLSMNYIKYANTKKCAAKINSMLEEVRTVTMTKKKSSISILVLPGWLVLCQNLGVRPY